MDRRRNKQQKTDMQSRLDEFPEDFDDVYFHNLTVEQDKRIPVLRSIVYKKIKNSIIDRVAEYKDDISINDEINIVIETSEFTRFQWAVIREELLDRGFDARFIFNKDDITSLVIPVERKIDLTETLEERLEKIDVYSDSESESSSEQ